MTLPKRNCFCSACPCSTMLLSRLLSPDRRYHYQRSQRSCSKRSMPYSKAYSKVLGLEMSADFAMPVNKESERGGGNTTSGAHFENNSNFLTLGGLKKKCCDSNDINFESSQTNCLGSVICKQNCRRIWELFIPLYFMVCWKLCSTAWDRISVRAAM